ncbi:MAG TPA: phosphate signaling complex protein PhoU [Thiothrix sp.]|nr:phosphate signaling complex protein PhoU [Thiothrix sp.]
MELGEHISQRYNQELEDIRSKVLKMGGLVEAQAENGVKALLQRDAELAENVATADDKINALEVEIDEDCVQVIALRQPTASDLRLVFAVGKVITDLERLGDEAAKIGKYSKKLAKKKTITGMHAELSHLSELALSLLHDSLDAFARLDDERAVQLLAKNDKINREFNALSRILITHMMENPRNIKNALRISWCARSLERIGRYSINICEHVVYLVKGKDIRHTDLDEVLAELFPDDDL